MSSMKCTSPLGAWFFKHSVYGLVCLRAPRIARGARSLGRSAFHKDMI